MNKQQLRFESSWDDGHPLDAKIIALLKKYNLPGTFYLNGLIFNEEVLKPYQGFEIGAHTANHPSDMKALNQVEQRQEIEANQVALAEALGHPVTKFCYPRGRFNLTTMEILKDLGFTEARTTIVLQTGVDDPMRKHTTIHVYQRGEYLGKDWQEVAYRMVEDVIKAGGIFHIWGHSWEIERDGNWEKLEAFFDWLTTNYEIIKT